MKKLKKGNYDNIINKNLSNIGREKKNMFLLINKSFNIMKVF